MESQAFDLSPEELSAFVVKLERFAGGLSHGERVLLQQMIDDAADAATEDASGYAELSGVLQEDEDEISGYAMDAGGIDSLGGAVFRYSHGVSRDENFDDLALVAGCPPE